MLPWHLLFDKKRQDRLNAPCPWCAGPAEEKTAEPEAEEKTEDTPPRLNNGAKKRPGHKVSRAKRRK